MPEVLVRPVEVTALSCHGDLEQPAGDHLYKALDRARWTAAPAEFIDNDQHGSEAWRATLRAPIEREVAPAVYAVLRNARLIHRFLVVDERGRAIVTLTPYYLRGAVPGGGTREITLSYDRERHVPGDTILLPVGASHMSHFLTEGFCFLQPIRDTSCTVLMALPPFDAFTEQLELAGFSRAKVLYRTFSGGPETLHDPEPWRFDRLIVPIHHATGIHPAQMNVFERVAAVVGDAARDPFLYVSRLDARFHRLFVNEEEVVPLMERKGFRVITCGELGEREKIRHFRGARVVVQPVGAGIYNSLFSASIEFQMGINSGSYGCNPLLLCAAWKGFRFGLHWSGEFLSFDPNGHKGQHNDLVVDLPKLERRLDWLRANFC